MTRSTVWRRTMTALLVGAAVVCGLTAIRVAASWTAAAAPLEASIPSANELRARLADETDRSTTLEDRLANLATHAQELESALTTAQTRLEADASRAQDLAAQLASAKKKLAALEQSIREAQTKGAAASVTTTATTGGHQGLPEPEYGDDD